MILAPIVRGRKGEYGDLFRDLKKRGYQRVRIDGIVYSLDEDLVLIKTNKHTIEAVVDRLTLDKKFERQRLVDSVEQALNLGSRELVVSKILDRGFSIPDKPQKMEDTFYSEKFACPKCGLAMAEIEPRLFSFNSPYGACPTCNGLGVTQSVDEARVLNPYLSILEGGILAFSNIESDTWFGRTVRKAFEDNHIPLNVEIRKLAPNQKRIILEGTGDEVYEVRGTNRFGENIKIYETYRGAANYLIH